MFNSRIALKNQAATLSTSGELAHPISPEADFAAELYENHRLIVLVLSKRGFSVVFMPESNV